MMALGGATAVRKVFGNLAKAAARRAGGVKNLVLADRLLRISITGTSREEKLGLFRV